VFPYSAWPDVEDQPPAPRPGANRPTAPAARPAAAATAAAAPGGEWRAVLARAEAVQGGGDGGVPALVRTSRGVIEAAPTGGGGRLAPEAAVNESLGVAPPLWGTAAAGASCSEPPAPAGRATFEAAARFDAHAGGLLLASALRAEAAGARPASACAPFGDWLRGPQMAAATATSPLQLAPGTTAPEAPPPARQRAVTLSLDSSLQRLRASVRSEAERRPGFLLNFRPLRAGDEDRYRSLGAPFDLRGPSIQRCG
jgi:hypothetical protein